MASAAARYAYGEDLGRRTPVVFPKGRRRRREVCRWSAGERECQPVPLPYICRDLRGRHRDTHTRPGRPPATAGQGLVPSACPPLWTRKRSGICRWGAHQARLTPAPDMHLRLAPPSLCMCRPSGSWNQDEASRWPAPCILPNPDLTGRCGQIPRWQSTSRLSSPTRSSAKAVSRSIEHRASWERTPTEKERKR